VVSRRKEGRGAVHAVYPASVSVIEAQGQAVVLDKGPDPPSPPTRRDTFQVFFGGGREEHVPALRKLTVQRCVHVCGGGAAICFGHLFIVCGAQIISC